MIGYNDFRLIGTFKVKGSRNLYIALIFEIMTILGVAAIFLIRNVIYVCS